MIVLYIFIEKFYERKQNMDGIGTFFVMWGGSSAKRAARGTGDDKVELD